MKKLLLFPFVLLILCTGCSPLLELLKEAALQEPGSSLASVPATESDASVDVKSILVLAGAMDAIADDPFLLLVTATAGADSMEYIDAFTGKTVGAVPGEKWQAEEFSPSEDLGELFYPVGEPEPFIDYYESYFEADRQDLLAIATLEELEGAYLNLTPLIQQFQLGEAGG